MSKKSEEKVEFNIDAEELAPVETPRIPVQQEDNYEEQSVKYAKRTTDEEDNLVNCLSNRKVVVRHLPQPGAISDPRHVLYGGMAETSTFTLTVPRLKSGTFVNVLTNEEKAFLEYTMGLEHGALNVYNKKDNFWSNATEGGISKVRLTKQDTELKLWDPVDYIKYKILLANKTIVAPNLHTLQDKPKATYRFVLIDNDDVNVAAKSKMTIKMKCYAEYGKIEDKPEVLRTVIEIITGKPLAKNTKIDFLQTKVGDLIEADAKLFYNVVKDPLLNNRILIQRCVEEGLISKRGDWYYLRSDNTPLCEGGEEPVLTVAAKYLSNPKRQEMKFSLEAMLNQK